MKSQIFLIIENEQLNIINNAAEKTLRSRSSFMRWACVHQAKRILENKEVYNNASLRDCMA